MGHPFERRDLTKDNCVVIRLNTSVLPFHPRFAYCTIQCSGDILYNEMGWPFKRGDLTKDYFVVIPLKTSYELPFHPRFAYCTIQCSRYIAYSNMGWPFKTGNIHKPSYSVGMIHTFHTSIPVSFEWGFA